MSKGPPMKVVFEFGDTDEDIARINALTRAIVSMPPADLQIGEAGNLKKPPKVTIHCPEEKAEEAKAAVKLHDSVEEVKVEPTDEDSEDVKKRLNEQARRLMKDLTAAGMKVKDMRETLQTKIGKDVTQLNTAELRQAIGIMEEMKGEAVA